MAYVCPVLMRQAYSFHHSTVSFITLQHTSLVELGLCKASGQWM